MKAFEKVKVPVPYNCPVCQSQIYELPAAKGYYCAICGWKGQNNLSDLLFTKKKTLGEVAKELNYQSLQFDTGQPVFMEKSLSELSEEMNETTKEFMSVSPMTLGVDMAGKTSKLPNGDLITDVCPDCGVKPGFSHSENCVYNPHIKAWKCLICEAEAVVDIDSQEVVCKNCGMYFDAEDYDLMKGHYELLKKLVELKYDFKLKQLIKAKPLPPLGALELSPTVVSSSSVEGEILKELQEQTKIMAQLLKVWEFK